MKPDPAVVLAGGGTAGHTNPLIATAVALQSLAPAAALTVIGTPKGLETTVIPAAGLPLELIEPVPLPRKPTPSLLAVPIRLRRAVAQAARILHAQRADVVVGFGSYVSLPVYLAARKLKVPLVIHEGNVTPGIANKIGARFAATVAATFPDTPLPGAQTIGLPVRREVATLDRVAAQPRARQEFGLPASGPVLLVSGGSQGARSLNTATEAARDRILAAGVSILHVLGANNFTDAHQPIELPSGAAYRPVAYVDGMERAYAAADLMLGRSGAGTVMETAMVGLPAVFVPLPHGNGEQARNAEFLVHAGAAILVPDAELTPEWLAGSLVPLALNRERLAQMGELARSLAPADASQTLAQLALAAIGEG
ncbi:MAG: undecaprenyldiphospho-muramoylpentapeptide beta-N-acetylglucosaminyltransferase [Propionibacteriaceae bacterium]|jgi:UDP-N-acetylglucosamine--N-acetylmuramyl-(pentapeptide) pyrophosphoryl-undecaprenol N-acetylglucosamine transferase|nr:undecaprenyldiphospho-muramoylpentapeptide beta-N-acetylglucosaminyltransferase [Propionibacteriaceae bacterium]